MVFKFCILAALATVASCGYASSSAYVKTAPSHGAAAASYGSYGHGAESHGSYGHESYPDSHPNYKFEYSVHDPHTHDVKAQAESRDGHYVKGFYSLVEADGTKRVVHYADNGHGFEATVHKEPPHHPISAPAHHPISAPVLHYSPSPSPAYHATPVYGKHA